ncbi:hypothetical protein ACLOJK_004216 [Asimina triloba]
MKKRLQKRARLLAEELVRKEGTDLQIAVVLEVAPIAIFEAPTEFDHARIMGLASANLHSLPEGPLGPLSLEGAPKVIDVEEEGGPAPPSVFAGEPKLFASEGSELETIKGDESLLCK